MKKFALRMAGLGLACICLTQCVVAPRPVVAVGPAPVVVASRPAYYGGGYGATGRVATNAMWAGVAAYGIHERNETRREIANSRNNRVNISVRNYNRRPVRRRW